MEQNRSMNDVQALLDERRRYEAWLEALDSRRDTTPAHVFERVQADYKSRLDHVSTQLSGHRQVIEEERASVVSRLALLGAEEQMRIDERAELGLRAHVGELAEADATSAFSTVDDSIEQLAAERSMLQGRVDTLDTLLAEQASAPSELADAAVGNTVGNAAGDAPSATPSFDEMAFLDAVVGEKAADSAEVPAPTPTSDAAAVPVNTAPTHVPAYERIVTPDESDAESLLVGLDGGASRGAEQAPLAANVASNTPIVLRTSSGVEQTKTLKCNECGAMNYPTEWYCERCGAELAAL
ncbi:MAG: hypothetical protein ABI205_03860 [Gemmatimonadaceae bacterium]